VTSCCKVEKVTVELIKMLSAQRGHGVNLAWADEQVGENVGT